MKKIAPGATGAGPLIIDLDAIIDSGELRGLLTKLMIEKSDETIAHATTIEALRIANEQFQDAANRHAEIVQQNTVDMRQRDEALTQLRADHESTVREKENLETDLTLVRGNLAEKEKQLISACEQIAAIQQQLTKAENVQDTLKAGSTALMQVDTQLGYFVGAAKLLIPQNEEVYAFLQRLKDPLDRLTAAVEAGDAYRTPQEINLRDETAALHKVLIDAQILFAKLQAVKSEVVALPLLHAVPPPPQPEPVTVGGVVREGLSLFRTVRTTITWLHHATIGAVILAFGAGLAMLVGTSFFIAWLLWG